MGLQALIGLSFTCPLLFRLRQIHWWLLKHCLDGSHQSNRLWWSSGRQRRSGTAVKGCSSCFSELRSRWRRLRSLAASRFFCSLQARPRFKAGALEASCCDVSSMLLDMAKKQPPHPTKPRMTVHVGGWAPRNARRTQCCSGLGTTPEPSVRGCPTVQTPSQQ